MDKIKESLEPFFTRLNEILSPITQGISNFFQGDMYVLYATILVLLAILVLAGLIACLKKIPKLFITLIVLLALFVVFWYFLGY